MWGLMALMGIGRAGDVLLNEVLYDVTGTDEGNEWIELCNAGTDEVDLAGWVIQVTSSSTWKSVYTFSSGSIAPGSYALVGAGSTLYPATFSTSLPNATSATSGVRLVREDGSTVEDTLLYGSPNTKGFLDDAGLDTRFADTVKADRSLARQPDCVDTDDASVDFVEFSDPTPEAENVEATGGGDTGDTGGSSGVGDCTDVGVRLNEVMPDPAGSDAGYEWVELYHSGTVAADLTGWSIEWGTKSMSKSFDLPDGTALDPGAFLLIGDTGVVGSDLVATLSLGNAGSNTDGVRLACNGGGMDTLIYGEDNEDEWPDDSADPAENLAPAPKSGVSIGRIADGDDTYDDGRDWALTETATPGTSNTEIPDCPGSEFVKINEFMPDPDGSDAGQEWIELYNTSGDSIDLEGWKLQWGSSGWSSSYVFEAGSTIAGNGYVLVGESTVANADYITTLVMGNASSSGDGLRLVHCGGGAADTVIYGPDNSDGFTDDNGEVATGVAPEPEGGISLARCVDGGDTDDSSVDFVVPSASSPGEANPECVIPVCEGGSLTIKVNELLANPSGTDTGYEWLELYNAGDSDQSLDSWVIEIGTKEFGEEFVFPGGTTIGAGEFMLLGADYVPAEVVDVFIDGLSLGNGGTPPDGLRLVDCLDEVQDTVLWGDGGDAEDALLLDDDGQQSMALAADDDKTFGRYPDGEDTDDNSVDFLTNLTPTPGEPNDAGSGDGGGGGGPSKGCGKSAKNDAGGPSKCASAGGAEIPAMGPVWALMSALVFLRRRRRA